MAVVWIQTIALLWLTLVIAEASLTAKPGCQNYCGNIEIPYPFGIGSNCSIGDWFSINCSSSTTPPTPFLSKIQSEVTDISVFGTMTINLPLTSSCNSSVQSVNLTESPFIFSQIYNIFTGVGCNNLALMVFNSSDVNSTAIGGCLSLCHEGVLSVGAYTCNGIDCCQTTIPSDLKVLDVNLSKIQLGETREGCKFGFLANQSWFNSNISRLSDLIQREFVPTVLEWTIPEPLFGSLQANLEASNSSSCRTVRHNSSFGNANSVPACNCNSGYGGNPYIFGGCQDIDECATLNVNSSFSLARGNVICLNTIGSYKILFISEPITRISPIGIGVSVAAGVFILLFGSWGGYKVVKKRKKAKRKEKFFKRNGGLLLKQQLMKGEVNVEKTKLFDSKELEKATDRFNANRILGQGGQGTVYKGMLVDGKIVAVKKSKSVEEDKIEEFINEVVILSQIDHRNIVKLMGCCLETEVPLLVYEFIPNGTLFSYLHEPNEELPLTWDMRMRIAAEIASALFYLHSAASQPIFHRDIKSSNILLDEKYKAKIADFGTSRSVAIDQTHLTTQVQGTFGYLDPEFFQSSQFTDKSDVYSFGVVLVELLTGQVPISQKRSKEGKGLALYFIDSMEGNTVFDILDGRVIKEGKREDIITVANLARRCLSLNGRARPTMKEVLMVLGSVQMTQKVAAMEADEFVRSEETMQWEQTSTSTRSDWNSDTFTLLDH